MKALENDRRRRDWHWLTAGLIASVLLALVLPGCGGGSGGTSSTSAEAEASAQFLGPNEKNQLVEFGAEASVAERDAASAILQRSFKAREAANFAAQCATLSKKAANRVGLARRQGSTHVEHGKCAKELEIIAEPLARTAPFRKDKLKGPITALRVKGNRGFALFHGTDGKGWVLPLEKEDGKWRVAAIQEEEIQPEPAKPGKSSAKRSTSKSTN